MQRQIEKNAKVSPIKAPLLQLLREVKSKKRIAALAKNKGITLYKNYPMIILYISGLYHIWLSKGVQSHEWIVDHIFDGIKQGYKPYIEKAFSMKPPSFRETLIIKTKNSISILEKVFRMKEKDKGTIVQILMELFKPKKNNKYDHKQVQSAIAMANLILEGPNILLESDDKRFQSTDMVDSKNLNEDKIFIDEDEPQRSSISKYYLDIDEFINPQSFL